MYFRRVLFRSVAAGVDFAVCVPPNVEVGQVVADVADLRRLAVPVQALGRLRPERVRVADGFGVQALVVVVADAGAGREAFGHGMDLGNIDHGSPGRTEAALTFSPSWTHRHASFVQTPLYLESQPSARPRDQSP